MCYVGHLSFCFATKTPSIGNLMMNNRGIKLTTAYILLKNSHEKERKKWKLNVWRGY